MSYRWKSLTSFSSQNYGLSRRNRRRLNAWKSFCAPCGFYCKPALARLSYLYHLFSLVTKTLRGAYRWRYLWRARFCTRSPSFQSHTDGPCRFYG